MLPSLLLPLWLLAPLGVPIPVMVDVQGSFQVPAPAGLEAVLVAEATAGKLSRMDMISGALLASGVAEAEVPAWRERVVKALAPSIARARRQADLRRRGRVLLESLHETVLRRYRAGATELSGVLDSGEFNCVSSTLLFTVAAQELLPEPRAVLTPSHAFARVTVDGKPLDVEATSPSGFAADRARTWTAEFARRLGVARALDGKAPDLQAEYARAVELPPLSLLAAIYSNRAVDLMELGDLRRAAVALDRATRVAQGPQKSRLAEWRATLLANVAADLVEKGREAEAIPLLRLGLQDVTGPSRDVLLHNLALAYAKQGEQLVNHGEPEEGLHWMDQASALGRWPWLEEMRTQALAQAAAKQGSAGRCNATTAPAGAAECLAQVSQALLDKEDVDQAVSVARRAVAKDAKAGNARVSMWNALGIRAARRAQASRCDLAEQDYREAERYRDVARDDPTTLEQNLGRCWGAAAYLAAQQGRQEDAETWLRRALVYQPAEPALHHNLATGQLRRAQALAADGRCDDARPRVAMALAHAPDLRATGQSILANCAYQRGMVPWQAKRWHDAAAEFRRGLQDAPANKELRRNLGAALHNEAAALVNAGDCGEARPLVAEARELGLEEAAALEARCR